jgi:LacI family transcriptional regulator
MKPLPRKKHICVSLKVAFEHQRGILRGINRFALSEPTWRVIFIGHEGGMEELERIGEVDGVIGNFSSVGHQAEAWAAARAVVGNRLVGISGLAPVTDVPRVLSDEEAVGRMAAAFFLEKGYRHFGYYHLGPGSQHGSSNKRSAAFCSALAEHGHDCRFLDAKTVYGPDFQLPEPCAVFAFNLDEARVLIDALFLRGIHVPEQVAVLGVDLDPLQQELSPIPLSTIRLDAPGIGFAAAALLKRIMAGEAVPAGHETLIAPVGVEEAASTEVLHCEDPLVNKALSLIRHEIAHLGTVTECAARIGTSRRKLERRFRIVLGKSVYDTMQAARVDYTKRLLVETELSLTAIAETAGYGDGRMLSVVFRRATGETPSAFRKRLRTTERGHSCPLISR